MPSASKYSSTSTGVGRGADDEPARLRRARAARGARLGVVGQRCRIRDALGLQAALSFSHTRGTRAETVGRTSGRRAEQSRGSGHVGDRAAEADRALVVRGPAVGDVGGGQERDRRGRRRARGSCASDRADLGDHVGVRELDALGRPGRARRVDQRQRRRRARPRARRASKSKPARAASSRSSEIVPPARRRPGRRARCRARRDATGRNARSVTTTAVAGVGEQVARSARRRACCRPRTASRRGASRRCRRGGTRAG